MNRFRRITLATLAGGLAAGVGFTAFGRGRGHEMDLDRMLKHLYVEIDATEEQKAKLEPIAKQAAKDLLPMRDSLRAGRGQAIELLTQERVDLQAIEALRAKQLQLADQASRRLTQAMADAAEVLTPAQRKELAAHVARRRWGHR
jgi:periplasmic protein CpxP/Spy